MANETPRMKITYPSIGEANYFSNYQAGMNEIDAGIFATWSASNTITNGGGTLTWDLVGPSYTLTWTAPIAFQPPAFGITQSIALGSLVIPQGLIAYTDIAFGSTAASTNLALTAVTTVPVDTAALVLAWHNPTTNALHFATGLVLALGDTATGIQPQGGGSISVTDGTITVNPTTAIDFTAGAVVTDGGGGTAEVLIPLTTKFVVAADGTGLFTAIQDGINAAHTAWIASGVDQIVFVRGGYYTENLTFKSGVRVVAEGNPNAKQDDNWIGAINRSPAAAVVVQGTHGFAATYRLRTTIQGITFFTASATLFTLASTGGFGYNTIQFFDCLLAGDSMGSGDTLFTVDDASCSDLSLHFERCRLFFLTAAGPYDPMMLLGSDGSDQFYTFVDCFFDTKGNTGRVYFGCNSSGACEARFTRCNLSYVDIVNDGSLGTLILGDLWVTDVTIEQPEKSPIEWLNGGTVYASRCNLAVNGGFPAIETGGGYALLDTVTTVSWYFTGEARTAEGIGVGNYVMPARTIEGTTARFDVPSTQDLDALFDQGYNITNLSWNTVGAAGLREVQLHNAAKTMGMYFTVWDSGNNANSNNITVTSPASAGGVTGPNTVIVDNNGSLTFVATINATNNACWRSISYFY